MPALAARAARARNASSAPSSCSFRSRPSNVGRVVVQADVGGGVAGQQGLGRVVGAALAQRR